MSFNKIISPIKKDLDSVDVVIKNSLHSDITIVNQIANHIIQSGGKRMRPILHLLLSGLSGEISQINYNIAAILELIHTATLLHDDVVDQSTKRRNITSANIVFGNSASVLVGDFIYSRSFQMMSEINNMDVMKLLSDTTNAISEGEILQLLNIHNPNIDEQEYFKVIEFKTAKLFEVCGSLAATINNNEKKISQCAKIGRNFGIIFQLTDDILDYSGEAINIGKNLGADLTEGKITLPLIYALEKSNKSQQVTIKKAIKEGGINNLSDVMQVIEETNAIKSVENKSLIYLNEIKSLLDSFEESSYKKTVMELAEFSVDRKN
ncbi:polyprenyl synthetase family protein [Methylophilaceae bacterium]|nr:polyprenyl synthetase family protein [Methylophilaceae bacterium]